VPQPAERRALAAERRARAQAEAPAHEQAEAPASSPDAE
jgi:hypothetical protein